METRAQQLFDLICSDGEKAIKELIARKEQEQLWLEFKTVVTSPGTSALDQGDLDHLAKCISGFGNSAGGVLVWGIDRPSNPQKPTGVRGVPGPDEFMAKVEGVVGACTAPPYEGIKNKLIQVDQVKVLVTYVSKSLLTPIQSLRSDRYYMRVGASFKPIPHDVLAGMFGRRPQPELRGQWTDMGTRVNTGSLTSAAEFRLRNDGPGLARDLYVNFHVELLGTKLEVPISSSSSPKWSRDEYHPDPYAWSWSFVAHDAVRLAPDFETAVFTVQAEFPQSYAGELKARVSFGHGHSPTTIIEIVRKSADIRRLLAKAVQIGPPSRFLAGLLTL
jgi:hypothetical protein